MAAIAVLTMLGGFVGGWVHATGQPEPLVGLIWQSAVDPTVPPGVNAPLWQLLIRTDVPSVYYKSGAADTAWTLIGTSSSSGGTVTGTGTANTITKWTGVSAIGSSSETDNGTTFAIGPSGRSTNIPNGFDVWPDATLTTPSAGQLAGGAVLWGNPTLAYMTPSGLIHYVGPNVLNQAVTLLYPTWDSAAAATWGGGNPTSGTATSATATVRTWASTNACTQHVRLGLITSASAGVVGGYRSNSAALTGVWRGNSSGLGGFKFLLKWCVSDTALVAGALTFVGIQVSTSQWAATADPGGGVGGMTSVFGACQTQQAGAVAADYYMCMSGTSNQGFTALTNTIAVTNTDVMELVLYAAPDSSAISWTLTDDTTGVTNSGTQSAAAALLANNVQLYWNFYRSNNTTAAAIGIDWIGTYQETPN